MTIEVRPLIFKPQYLNGLTEKLVVSHYENNYGGALRRLNAIEARIGHWIGRPPRCSKSTASSARN